MLPMFLKVVTKEAKKTKQKTTKKRTTTKTQNQGHYIWSGT